MRIIRRSLMLIVVLGVLFGAVAGLLAARTAKPRAAEGWVRLADMPQPRGEVAAATFQPVPDDFSEPLRDHLYVMGGITGAGTTVDRVDIYDAAEDRWIEGPSLPEPRHHAGAVAHSAFLFVTGGSSRAIDWTPEATMWMLAASEDRWTEGPAMPEGRMGHQIAGVAGKLYVIGGRGESSNVLIYDIADRRWSLGAQMPRRRDHLGIAVVGTKIYAIGGRDDQLTSQVDIYDTETDAWDSGPALPQPMSAMAVAFTTQPQPGIHVVGGEDPATFGGTVIDKHYFLPTGSRTWMEAPLPVVATHGSAAAVLDGRLHIAGGARRQGALSPLGWTGVLQRFGEEE